MVLDGNPLVARGSYGNVFAPTKNTVRKGVPVHIKRILCRLLCVDRAAVRGLRMEGGALVVECAP